MLKLKVSISWSSDLDNLDDRVYRAVVEKFVALNEELYNKVIENLSGRILNKQTGALLSQIRREVTIGTEQMFGEVFVSPESPKAWALEKGGTGYYTITPTKALMLRFFWDKMGQVVYLHSVNHPPSKEYGYLRHALEELAPLIPEEMSFTIQQALAGRMT